MSNRDLSDLLLFRLAGMQKRAHPELALTRRVLLLACIKSEFGSLAPRLTGLESFPEKQGSDFEIHRAYTRALAMGPAATLAMAGQFVGTFYPADWRVLAASLVVGTTV